MAYITWDIDPIVLDLGPVQIRYYGIVFALTILCAYIIWRKQMVRGGYTLNVADKFLLWAIVAVVAGARLGHCLFYEPDRFLSDPLSIIFFWEGGLASHGATVGLIIALFLFSRTNKLNPLEMMDRFTFAAAIGAAGVRLGNFMNSEIVGRVTDVPWAVVFIRYRPDNLPRHPSQIYEFGLGIGVLSLLILVDRLAGREKRPIGLLLGVFLTTYFLGRFFVEYVKEYQTLKDDSLFTMGQYLSMIPCAAGVWLVIWSLMQRRKSKQGKTA